MLFGLVFGIVGETTGTYPDLGISFVGNSFVGNSFVGNSFVGTTESVASLSLLVSASLSLPVSLKRLIRKRSNFFLFLLM